MRSIAVIVLLVLPLLASSYFVKIGILSDDPDVDKTKKVWSIAQTYRTMMSLEPVVHVTQWWSNLDAASVTRAVCGLAKSGMDALVFLGPPRWNALVSSYSTSMGLPFITALEPGMDMGRYQVSMLPDTTDAAADFITHFGWNTFVFIYESDNGPDQLQKILRSVLSAEFIPRVEAFWKASDVDHAFRYIHQLLQPSSTRRIVLATSERFADQLVSRLARGQNFDLLLLTPVGIVQRNSDQGFYKLTKLSVVEPKDTVLPMLENRLKTIPSYSARGRTGKDVPDSVILHYDSSLTLNTMYNKIAAEMPSALKPEKNLKCLETADEVSETVDYLKKTTVEHGATGKIAFDESGRRSEYHVNIMQTTPFDVQKIGTWSDKAGLRVTPEFAGDSPGITYASYKNDPPIKVTSILTEPFLYRNEDGSFRGFAIDFLDELFNVVIKRDYELRLVKDGYYGIVVNGKWNGMIGELIRGEADLAVAPIMKTTARAKVIDFSKNVMTTGLNILMKKPKSEMDTATFEPFSFLTIWPIETWMALLVVVAIFSVSGYGISRFIGAPDRVRALETKGTDNLSPCGSIWFTVGSLFCRDTGIYPRNLTHRLWALLWWILCIFISLLYVSMLTSSLIKARTTITTTYSRKSSQQLLQESLDTGTPSIGVLRHGSTMNFFLNSEIGIYEQYGRYLREHPEVLISSLKEGVERVKKSEGSYALITESTFTKLMADKECDTLVTSGFLNTLPYAIALQKNSTLKEVINHGILILTETGKLRNLYEKWWHNETSTCEDPALNILPKVYTNSMTLHEVSGVFYLFILFALISVAAAAAEYYIRTRNIRVE